MPSNKLTKSAWRKKTRPVVKRVTISHTIPYEYKTVRIIQNT